MASRRVWLVWDDGFTRQRENVTIVGETEMGLTCLGKNEEDEEITFFVSHDQVVLTEAPR